MRKLILAAASVAAPQELAGAANRRRRFIQRKIAEMPADFALPFGPLWRPVPRPHPGRSGGRPGLGPYRGGLRTHLSDPQGQLPLHRSARARWLLALVATGEQ